MTYAEIEKLAWERYPDINTTIDTGDSPIQIPEIFNEIIYKIK